MITIDKILGIPLNHSHIRELDTRYLKLSGSTNITGSLVPDTDSAIDLGSSSKYWANIYADKVFLASDWSIEYGSGGTPWADTTLANATIKGGLKIDAGNRGSLNNPVLDIYADVTAGNYDEWIRIFDTSNVNAPSRVFGIGRSTSSSNKAVIYLPNGQTGAHGNIQGHLVPETDSIYDLGSTVCYWAETYTDKLYLNSTAILDGATAGVLLATGRLDIAEIRARDAGGLKLYDDGGNGIFVKDGGNVGIGTTGPGAKLGINSATTTTTGAIFKTTDDNNANNIIEVVNSSNVELFTVRGSGDTRIMSGDLSIRANNAATLQVFDTDTGLLALLGDNSAVNDGQLKLYTNDQTQNVLIRGDGNNYINSGNVGIGTTAPTEKLDINSDAIRIRTAQTPASGTATGDVGSIAWDNDFLYIWTATNVVKRVALSSF